MTKAEHKLMLLMFAKQTQHIKTLLQILESKGILEGDDAAAFNFATRADVPTNAALVLEVVRLYAGIALNLGMDPIAILQDLPKAWPPSTPSHIRTGNTPTTIYHW